jgi:hypothetical protein
MVETVVRGTSLAILLFGDLKMMKHTLLLSLAVFLSMAVFGPPALAGIPTWAHFEPSGTLDAKRYPLSMAFDGRADTAWCVKAPPATLDISLREDRSIEGISVRGGLQKNNVLYLANARPKNVTVTYFDDAGEVLGKKSTTAEDVFGKTYSLSLPESAVPPSRVRFEIESSYPGTKFTDLCVSELEVKTRVIKGRVVPLTDEDKLYVKRHQNDFTREGLEKDFRGLERLADFAARSEDASLAKSLLTLSEKKLDGAYATNYTFVLLAFLKGNGAFAVNAMNEFCGGNWRKLSAILVNEAGDVDPDTVIRLVSRGSGPAAEAFKRQLKQNLKTIEKESQ